LSVDADQEITTAVGDVEAAAKVPGVEGAMSSSVVAEAGADWAEWLPAASNASTVYEYVKPWPTVVSE
jgi:hypothetical protein